MIVERRNRSYQAAVAKVARELFAAAEAAKDQASADLATRRLVVHEKNAWVLQNHLE